MRHEMSWLGLGIVVGSVVLATAARAETVGLAADAPDSSCWSMHGTLNASFTAEGCQSPMGLCTAGVIDMSPPFLRGTTYYTANGLGGAPVGEQSIVTPPVEPGTTWSYVGVLRIETPWGTLTLNDVGVLDGVALLFSEFDRVQSGTGLFDGATGVLFFYGYITPDGSGFDASVSGRICVPFEPRHRARH